MLARMLQDFLAGLRDGPRLPPPAYLIEFPAAELSNLSHVERSSIATALDALHAGRPARARRLLARNAVAAHAGPLHALAGMAALEAGDAAAANASFAAAKQCDAAFAGRMVAQGMRYIEAQDARRALGLLVLALQLEPANPLVMSRIGDAYFLASESATALDWIATAYRNSGNDALRLKHVLMRLPAILASSSEGRAARAAYLDGLRELEASALHIKAPFRDLNLTNFYLAYHGEDELQAQKQLARIVAKACPGLVHVAPHCRHARVRGAAIKIGFVSRNLGLHSVGMAFNALLAGLHAKPGFSVIAACMSSDSADFLAQLLGSRGPVRLLPEDPEAMRTAIEQLELDILVYPDIGMDPTTYLLSFSRLAPLQCVLAGHPLTTGVPSIDAYISSKWWEPADAAAHYSEQLVLQDGMAFYMQPRPIPSAPRPRVELGLPADRHLYVCPMALQKLHPDFDLALAGILDADPQAEIVLFEDHRVDAWARIVRSRIESALGPQRAGRVRFHPWVSMDTLFEILLACEVMLDTFPFSGGTTAFYALSAGCPVVTLAGRFMRGRLACGYLRRMGLEECLATDISQFTAIAVRIASDSAYRRALRSRCASQFPRLLDTDRDIDEFATTLVNLLAEGDRQRGAGMKS